MSSSTSGLVSKFFPKLLPSRTRGVRPSVARSGLLVLSVIASVCVLGGAGEPDAQGDKLARARWKFQMDMDRVGVRVVKALEAEKKRNRPNVNKPIEAEIKAFQESGVWPSSLTDAVISKDAQEDRETLDGVYQSVIDELQKKSGQDTVKAVKAERDMFRSENWLTPWASESGYFKAEKYGPGDDWKIEDKALENKKQDKPSLLKLNEIADDRYQVEVKLKRRSGKGDCTLLLPFAGKIAGVTIDDADKGSMVQIKGVGVAPAAKPAQLLPENKEVALIVTVRDRQIAVDGERARIVDWQGGKDDLAAPSDAGKPKQLGLLVAKGTVFSITSVRVRPILEGKEKIAEVKKAEAPKKDPKPAKEPAVAQDDPFPVGRTWVGEWSGRDGDAAHMKVAERNGEAVVLTISREGGGHFRVEGTVSGNTFRVNDVTDHVPGGHNRVIRNIEHTMGEVRDNELRVHLKFNWDVGRGKGRVQNEPYEKTASGRQK